MVYIIAGMRAIPYSNDGGLLRLFYQGIVQLSNFSYEIFL